MSKDFVTKNLEKIIKESYENYVKEWKNSSYIKVPEFKNAYLERNITPIEQKYLLIHKLPKLHVENPEMPKMLPEIPIKLLRKLPIYLNKTLEIQINDDHLEYWAWTAEVFNEYKNKVAFFNDIDEEVKKAIFTLFHACLMELMHPPVTKETFLLNNIITMIVSRHVQNVVLKKYLVAAPLAFLVFESLIKNLCKHYNTIANLRERIRLGFLLKNKFEKETLPMLPEEFKANIIEFNDTIEAIWGDGRKKWYNIISEWRNNLLHGSKTWLPKVYGVITNYICLILWHFIPEEEYEKNLKSIIDRIRFSKEMTLLYGEIGRHFTFYPP